MTLVCKSVGIVNPIYGCGVIITQDINPIQCVQEKVKKSNHLVWYKNKVEFLFLAHPLRGKIW